MFLNIFNQSLELQEREGKDNMNTACHVLWYWSLVAEWTFEDFTLHPILVRVRCEGMAPSHAQWSPRWQQPLPQLASSLSYLQVTCG